MKYDVVVIGAGGAGLACAEMLSRTCGKILLIEKNRNVCNEASGEHHGWFHFGSLYSIFPPSKFMGTLISGIEDLLKYYKDFDGMNVRVNEKGKLQINESVGGWLQPEPIDYYIACGNDADFELLKTKSITSRYNKLSRRIAWAYMIRKFVARHNHFLDYEWLDEKKPHMDIPKSTVFRHSKRQLKYITNADVNMEIGTHFSIAGFDHPMRTMKIAKDLLKSFLSNKGKLMTEVKIMRIEKNNEGYELFDANGKIALAEKLVIATGKHEGLASTLKKTVNLKKTISPLLVTYPNVTDANFVRMTPFMERTINHIFHNEGGNNYSVIGGGYYLAEGASQEQKDEVEKLLCAHARRIFPKFEGVKHWEIYWGTKTEYVGGGIERNYQYFSKEIEKNIWIAIPGKFTLSFSLAIDLYQKINGAMPPEKSHDYRSDQIDVSSYVGSMRHAQIASNAANA